MAVVAAAAAAVLGEGWPEARAALEIMTTPASIFVSVAAAAAATAAEKLLKTYYPLLFIL